MGYTPMIQQYLQIKEQYQDCILFFRLGDFYEMFFEDAITASAILDIALTSRDGGIEKVPMCGIPYHAYESYVAKLLAHGYKVAICEQMEDPALAKGIVRREVIRVITPGTVMDEKVLLEKANNYLAAVVTEQNSWGLAYIDISTGEFCVTQCTHQDVSLLDELIRLKPAELIIPEALKQDGFLLETLKQIKSYLNWRPVAHRGLGSIMQFLEKELSLAEDLAGQLYKWPLACQAAYYILEFLQETQKQKLGHLTELKVYRPKNYMLIDAATRRNLELTENMQTKSVRGSLLGVLDETVTAMGARKLKHWLEAPLLDKNLIQARLDAVEELVENALLRESLRKAIKGIYDLERLVGRVAYGSANARDLLALKQSIGRLPQIAALIDWVQTRHLRLLIGGLDLLADIFTLLDRSIAEDPPASVREGNIIKTGFHAEVDRLREAARHGKQWIAELEAKERERTGIRSLKVGFNKVFGYYLEVTKPNLHMVPQDYHRKQTLANAERFITAELKEKENLILGAEEKLNKLEYEIFTEIRGEIERNAGRLQKSANIVAELDVLLSLAIVAIQNDYCKPELVDHPKLELIEARHPVVEKLAEDRFVANDCYLEPPACILNIITGPNMAGKSTYIRTAALITIMAQIGSFVPARKAVVGIADRIFARVGASDDLSTGRSTFMVEMNEVANILQHATERSLVILDEVGRGTSTFDGISIAWAVSEYLLTRIKARTLFATHYHELTLLQEEFPAARNFCMAVKEEGSKVTFLRKVVPGAADRSYGIHVAELAGLPQQVIQRAHHLLAALEERKREVKETVREVTSLAAQQAGGGNGSDGSRWPEEVHGFLERFRKLDMDGTSPIEAWHLLSSFAREAEELLGKLAGGKYEPDSHS